MVMAIESTLEQNPEYSYRYYNGSERRQFIKDNMSPTVLDCYEKLIPGAFKADLFRYSIVYIHGGCYADIGFVFVRSLRDALHSEDQFISTPDGLSPLVINLNSAFFCATPKHPILDLTIRRLVYQVSHSYYGEDMLDISGPWTFRRGFSSYFNKDFMVLEESSYA